MTPDLAKLKALQERVRVADGPDREIDLALATWLYESQLGDGLVNYDPALWLERNGGWTGSLDAAVALIEHVLPGWAWGVSQEPPIHPITYLAFVSPQVGDLYGPALAEVQRAKGAALALVEVALVALIAQAENQTALSVLSAREASPTDIIQTRPTDPPKTDRAGRPCLDEIATFAPDSHAIRIEQVSEDQVLMAIDDGGNGRRFWIVGRGLKMVEE